MPPLNLETGSYTASTLLDCGTVQISWTRQHGEICTWDWWTLYLPMPTTITSQRVNTTSVSQSITLVWLHDPKGRVYRTVHRNTDTLKHFVRNMLSKLQPCPLLKSSLTLITSRLQIDVHVTLYKCDSVFAQFVTLSLFLYS